MPGSKAGDAECAIVNAPRDYASPNGPSLELALKRFVPKGQLRAQLWLVDGGPGGSIVNAFKTLGRKVLTLRSDIAVYGVDHRGVGGSHPLDCPGQEAASSEGGSSITESEWGACVSELETREANFLNHITTTNSMRDLAALVERVREPNVPVIVYGGSYGSYAVARYLELFPKQADGVVLEGINPPGRNFDAYDVEMNATAKQLMTACKNDASCAAHLGADPWATATSVVSSFDSGHCSVLNLDTDGARAFLGSYLFFSPIRDYIPILIHRMKRCEPRDVKAIVKFYEASKGGAKMPIGGPLAFNDGKRDTKALFFHVALSEMWHWDGLPNPADVLSKWRQGTMSTGLTVGLANRQKDWPIYPRGAEVDATLPAYDGPLLMLQGGFDPATPLEHATRLRDAYQGQYQTWAEFPQGSHMIMEGTPTDSGTDCGRELVFQFLDDPKSKLDTSCLDTLAPINFDGAPAVNQLLLGVADGWDG